MATYRAFLINDEGHFTGVQVLDGCQADEDAISAAKLYVDGCAVEVWDLRRRVARLNQDGTIERLGGGSESKNSCDVPPDSLPGPLSR
jgi:hypothetical protein